MQKVILSTVMLFCSILVFSQSECLKSSRKVQFGYYLGADYSILQSKEALPDGSDIYNSVGAKLGVLMDYSLTKNWFLSPKAEFSYYQSGVETEIVDNSTNTYKVFPFAAEIMTHMVYKFGKGENVPYLLAGPNFKIPLSFSSKSSTEYKNRYDFAIDFGIGLEHIFKYFNFAPELRYSLGLLNVNENPTFQTLKFHNVSLVFNFK